MGLSKASPCAACLHRVPRKVALPPKVREWEEAKKRGEVFNGKRGFSSYSPLPRLKNRSRGNKGIAFPLIKFVPIPFTPKVFGKEDCLPSPSLSSPRWSVQRRQKSLSRLNRNRFGGAAGFSNCPLAQNANVCGASRGRQEGEEGRERGRGRQSQTELSLLSPVCRRVSRVKKKTLREKEREAAVAADTVVVEERLTSSRGCGDVQAEGGEQ